MALFGRKKKEEPIGILPTPPTGAEPIANIPTDQVLNLRQKGYSDDQIMQYLQGQGFNTTQISDAMNQANIGMPSTAMPAAPIEPQPTEFQPPPMEGPMPPAPEEKDRIEEVAEAIIDEKWNDLLKDINKVIEWKEKTESRISKLEQSLKDLKSSFESLHQGMLGKISEYDKNITDVGTEIKAMERVFQKVLPTFTENVNKLDRLAKGLSSKK